MGFSELELLYKVVTAELGQPAVIVDAADLLDSPEASLRAWCDAVGVPFDDAMTSWEPSAPKSWDKWAGWHNEAAASSGFAATHYADAAEPLSDEARRIVDACQPIYDRLHAMRLGA